MLRRAAGVSRTLALGLAALVILAASADEARSAPVRRSFDIDAPIGMLLEVSSGRVLFEKGIDTPHPPASLVKIMTMLLLMEAIESEEVALDDSVVVSARASRIGGSQAYLADGEEMSVDDLLKAVAIHSANDACVALAEFLAGDTQAFVDRMNDKARELRMDNTVFITPHGLPPERGQEADTTTARDVMTMARELIVKHPAILKYTGRKQDSLRGGKFRLDNTNKLLGRVSGVDGLKTGYTRAAGFALAATAERRGLRFVSIVMGASSGRKRSNDSARLLSYGFANLRNYLATKEGRDISEVDVPGGMSEKVMALAGSDFRILIKRGQERDLQFEVKPLADLSAPIQAGQEIATYVALLDGEVVGKIPLVARNPVEKANLIIRFFRWLLALLNIS